MALRFKVINAQKLKASAFTRAFLRAAQTMARDMHNDLDQTTEEFRHNVTFRERVTNNGNGKITVTVKTNDLGFKYYDQGNGGPTRIIRPVNSRYLHWVDKSGEDVFRKFVRGYDGRHVIDRLNVIWDEKAPEYFEAAMQDAVRNGLL